MAKKIYFDCNILIDWNLARQPFNKQAEMLIKLVKQGEILGFVSPLGLTNAHYTVKKAKDKALANEFIKDCQKLFHFINNPATALTQAIDEPYKDFEDDLHFYSALENGITTFVTRNPKDFPKDTTVQILTPDELLYELGY